MGPGFAEQLRSVGFAAAMPQVKNKPVRPNIGYAWAIDNPELALNEAKQEEKAKSRSRKKKAHSRDRQDAAVHDFPPVTVARKMINKEKSSEWKRFHKAMEDRSRGWGKGVRVLPLTGLKVTYISPEQMNAAMIERYGDMARDTRDNRRKGIAQEVARRINGLVVELCGGQAHAINEGVLGEPRDMRERAMLRDEFDVGTQLSGQQLYMADADPAADEPATLWLPHRFELGDPNGCGPKGFGLDIVDEQHIMASERSELVARMCSSMGFNPVHFEGIDLQVPKVQMIESVQDLSGRQLRLPPAPIVFMAQAPHAFADVR